MKWTRRLRRHFTQQASRAAAAVAPRLSPATIDRLAVLAGYVGRTAPVVSRQVAENMRALGVYTPDHHRAYFAWVGRHLAGAVHAMACRGQGTPPNPYLLNLARERVELDETIVALGRRRPSEGVVLVGPHICNYLLNLTRLADALPLTVYLRFSRDAHRQAIKQRWYRASGVEAIAAPPGAGGALGRMRPLAEALRAGRVLFVTPDLPQKQGDGLAVRFFDRQILVPQGAALLAARARSPLYFLSASSGGTPRQRLYCLGPFTAGRAEQAGRGSFVQQAMQWFADQFAELLRREPALWYLWGDKRWTRVLHGDLRYVPGQPGDAAGRAAGLAGGGA